jgi:hypothetical protein
MFCRCGIQLALRRDRSRERLFRLLHRIVLWCCKVDVRRRSGESLGVAFVVAEAAIKAGLAATTHSPGPSSPGMAALPTHVEMLWKH